MLPFIFVSAVGGVEQTRVQFCEAVQAPVTVQFLVYDVAMMFDVSRKPGTLQGTVATVGNVTLPASSAGA